MSFLDEARLTDPDIDNVMMNFVCEICAAEWFAGVSEEFGHWSLCPGCNALTEFANMRQ